jgi:hypothetical protein
MVAITTVVMRLNLIISPTFEFTYQPSKSCLHQNTLSKNIYNANILYLLFYFYQIFIDVHQVQKVIERPGRYRKEDTALLILCKPDNCIQEPGFQKTLNLQIAKHKFAVDEIKC